MSQSKPFANFLTKKSPMRIFSIIIAAVVLVLAVVVIARDARFTLDNEFYGHGEIVATDLSELQTLVADQKSFALFVSQPGCRTADDFRKVLQAFLDQHPMQFFEIAFSELKGSGIASEVKFYPSFVIFRAGRVVAYLDADSDTDAAAYSSLDAFTTWFTNHVALRD